MSEFYLEKSYERIIYFVSDYNEYLLIAFKAKSAKEIVLFVENTGVYNNEQEDIIHFFNASIFDLYS